MITALIGNNFYLRKQHITKLKTAFIERHGNLAVELIDASENDYQDIEDKVTNSSLFSDSQLIIINNFDQCKVLLNQLEKFIQVVPKTNDVVLVAESIDKRLGAYGILKKHTQFVDCLQPSSLLTWIIDTTQSLGGTIARSDAQFLLDRIGPNQILIFSEIEKLVIYEPAITKANIELLTEATPQSSVFQLLEAVFHNNTAKIIKLYKEQRIQKVEPLAIIGLLTWQLLVFATIKAGEQHNIQDVAKEARLNPYVVSKSKALIKQFSLAHIQKMFDKLLALEIRLKSKAIDADDALQLFLIGELV